MGAATCGDTSSLPGEIYRQHKNGKVAGEMIRELKSLGEALATLICDWMEFNNVQISKGKLFNKMMLAQ